MNALTEGLVVIACIVVIGLGFFYLAEHITTFHLGPIHGMITH